MAAVEDVMGAPLWEMSAERRALLDAIDEAEGEVTPEQEARLDELTGSIEEKTSVYLARYRERKAAAEGIRYEIDRLSRMLGTLDASAYRWRDRIREALIVAGVDRVDCGALGKVSIRAGSQRVHVDDLDKLPPGLVRLERKPDKRLIGDALKSGEDVPGARLETGSPTVVIR